MGWFLTTFAGYRLTMTRARPTSGIFGRINYERTYVLRRKSS
jgi:hypothetical protein